MYMLAASKKQLLQKKDFNYESHFPVYVVAAATIIDLLVYQLIIHLGQQTV